MFVECVDTRFSTTRRLIRRTAETAAAANVRSDVTNILTGGLRTKGLLKAKIGGPIITVVTVIFNGESDLEETILSVLEQSYDNIEYIVIDGGSTDGTLAIIRRYEHAIDFWLSEQDRGIYDAMNKGIRLSSGDWLSFMNAGDLYNSRSTVETVVRRYIDSDGCVARFFYSDVVLAFRTSGGKKLHHHECDHARKIINHQASVYSKALHDDYGLYLVSKELTISDYLFFSLINPSEFAKVDQPIAQYDVTGVSQSKRAVEQKFVVDYLVNGLPRWKFVIYFLAYFYYRELKTLHVRFKATCSHRMLAGIFRPKDT